MKKIIENFRFLAMETENQVKMIHGLLAESEPSLLEKISSKDDYIDNLKTTIENDCFSEIHTLPKNANPKTINEIRAIHIVCVNLERIADFCVNVARQTLYLSDPRFIHKYNYTSMCSEAIKSLNRIPDVFEHKDLSGALDICRSEFLLDQFYKENFDLMMAELKKSSQSAQVADLVTSIFIFRYLERIGDSLLNIGEALIFAIIGDRIKIRQIDALQKTLSESGFEGTLSDIDITSIWGSRSGCRIGKVGDKRPAGFKAQGIFKEGTLKKIKKEKENIERWNALLPGIAPRIFGYYEKHATASMLVEFLAGCTLDQIILTEKDDVIRNVIFLFEQTVAEIWNSTLHRRNFQTDYMKQLQSRFAGIYRVHPYFTRLYQRIGNADILSSHALIENCERIEKQIPAPFTIFIHGDFNTNNIIYNHAEQKINYIDLYRSGDGDYVQDASVFLVSHFRLPVFDTELRERLNTATLYFFEFFSEFAQKHGDRTVDARMALALARSFYTSTRFELNYGFARTMYLRACYLMERICEHEGKDWEDFRLPEDILFY
ncbi:MAG: PhoU domain-containing protein [Desulfobacterales bacterium]